MSMFFIVKGRTEDDNLTDVKEDTVVGPVEALNPSAAVIAAEEEVGGTFLSGDVYPLQIDSGGDILKYSVDNMWASKSWSNDASE